MPLALILPRGDVCVYVYVYGHHIKQSIDQSGKVANPARGQLNGENNIPLSPCMPENLVSVPPTVVSKIAVCVRVCFLPFNSGHKGIRFNPPIIYCCLKKSLNASKPSEHPPDRGKIKRMSKRLGKILGCKDVLSANQCSLIINILACFPRSRGGLSEGFL